MKILLAIISCLIMGSFFGPLGLVITGIIVFIVFISSASSSEDNLRSGLDESVISSTDYACSSNVDDRFVCTPTADYSSGISQTNPATGLPMVGNSIGGIDVGGNPFGTDISSGIDDSFGASFENSFSSGIDDSFGSPFDDDYSSGIGQINPATGLPMVGDSIGGIDVGGNPYGTDISSDIEDSFGSSITDSFSSGIDDSFDTSFDDSFSSGFDDSFDTSFDDSFSSGGIDDDW